MTNLLSTHLWLTVLAAATLAFTACSKEDNVPAAEAVTPSTGDDSSTTEDGKDKNNDGDGTDNGGTNPGEASLKAQGVEHVEMLKADFLTLGISEHVSGAVAFLTMVGKWIRDTYKIGNSEGQDSQNSQNCLKISKTPPLGGIAFGGLWNLD